MTRGRPSPPAQSGATTLDTTVPTVVTPHRCDDCGRSDNVLTLHDGRSLCGPCGRPFGVETTRGPRQLVRALAHRQATEITTELRREPRRGQPQLGTHNPTKALVRS